uniref:SWIM-type domain-containing protein n=1 Tax=Noctiluca scintillans TaxID=2966 RepID=A0A7S1F9R1_NOCSC|mmetsp:Transcript_42953/g.113171  ORF Transcript_42953/g.113171 Transcript_42953/m.113171 type:complete len:153 (+) Transcript_42953:66-524(+)
MAADVSSQVCRMVALQDLLGAFPNQSGETGDASTASILVGLSTLVPDEVLQHALQIVDTNGVTCVQSETGRKVFEVRGTKTSHVVLMHGCYCTCLSFSRHVLGGGLCCKHWLAAQLARRGGRGIGSVSMLDDGDFVEWLRQRVTGPSFSSTW